MTDKDIAEYTDRVNLRSFKTDAGIVFIKENGKNTGSVVIHAVSHDNKTKQFISLSEEAFEMLPSLIDSFIMARQSKKIMNLIKKHKEK